MNWKQNISLFLHSRAPPSTCSSPIEARVYGIRILRKYQYCYIAPYAFLSCDKRDALGSGHAASLEAHTHRRNDLNMLLSCFRLLMTKFVSSAQNSRPAGARRTNTELLEASATLRNKIQRRKARRPGSKYTASLAAILPTTQLICPVFIHFIFPITPLQSYVYMVRALAPIEMAIDKNMCATIFPQKIITTVNSSLSLASFFAPFC